MFRGTDEKGLGATENQTASGHGKHCCADSSQYCVLWYGFPLSWNTQWLHQRKTKLTNHKQKSDLLFITHITLCLNSIGGKLKWHEPGKQN